MMAFRICLASASPRRRALLEQLGLQFEVRAASADETAIPGEMPGDYVTRVAIDKANEVASRLADDRLVIGADTTVTLGGEMFGKPRDRQDALRMLAALGGNTHEVFTAVAIRGADTCRYALSRSMVSFRPVSRAEADAYWETGEPADKAGAYAIQGRGAAFVTRLSGSYSGVMGLPLFETARLLDAFGYRLFGGRN